MACIIGTRGMLRDRYFEFLLPHSAQFLRTQVEERPVLVSLERLRPSSVKCCVSFVSTHQLLLPPRTSLSGRTDALYKRSAQLLAPSKLRTRRNRCSRGHPQGYFGHASAKVSGGGHSELFVGYLAFAAVPDGGACPIYHNLVRL